VNRAFSLARHKQLVVTSRGHKNVAHGGPAIPQQNIFLGENGLAVVVGWERQREEKIACSKNGRGVREDIGFSLITYKTEEG